MDTDTQRKQRREEEARELRAKLEADHPSDVYDTDELREKFEVIGFCAPCVVVTRIEDGKKGSLMFTHLPRFYYGWVEHTKEAES